jgi:hypothetical protein
MPDGPRSRPVDSGETMIKFDDFDFHAGEAVARGRSEDDAFTHIGFMLSWLARHGLVSSSTFPKSVVRQLEAGSLRPNDLRDLVDGKLVSSMLSGEGSSFLQRYYPNYLDDWALEFADHPLYAVPDDAIHEARIDGRIEAAYQRWIGEGRPRPQAGPPPWAGGPDDHDMQVPRALAELLETGRVRPADASGGSHIDPDLEKRIQAAVGRPIRTKSADGQGGWGAGFNRALRNLALSKTAVVVATGLEKGPCGVSIEVDHLPGVEASDLAAQFRPFLENRVRGKWRDLHLERVACRSSIVSMGPIGKRSLLWFALDGYIAYIGGPDDQSVREIGVALISELRRA